MNPENSYKTACWGGAVFDYRQKRPPVVIPSSLSELFPEALGEITDLINAMLLSQMAHTETEEAGSISQRYCSSQLLTSHSLTPSLW